MGYLLTEVMISRFPFVNTNCRASRASSTAWRCSRSSPTARRPRTSANAPSRASKSPDFQEIMTFKEMDWPCLLSPREAIAPSANSATRLLVPVPFAVSHSRVRTRADTPGLWTRTPPRTFRPAPPSTIQKGTRVPPSLLILQGNALPPF